MARRKKAQEITDSLDPQNQDELHITEEGRKLLLELSAELYQHFAERKAEGLPDGKEKEEMLRAAKMFERLRPSVRAMEELKWEQRKRQWEAEERAREKERQYVQRELNRMKALPEPVFVLDLPDDVIQKLIAKGFDTVGKALFGVQVSTDTAVQSSSDEDWKTATMHSRNLLIKAVGQEGYNLVGSRLMQFGYLQRDAFLASVREEAERRAGLARYAEEEADGSAEET